MASEVAAARKEEQESREAALHEARGEWERSQATLLETLQAQTEQTVAEARAEADAKAEALEELTALQKTNKGAPAAGGRAAVV